MSEGIWLVTGAQASGKSTIAELLAQTFDKGVHVRGGQFYRWVTRGWVHFDDPAHPAEARRLLELRYRLSALVAAEYAEAGFTAVAQDNIYGQDVTDWLSLIGPVPKHLVVLRPNVDAICIRHEERRRLTGKVAYRGSYTPTDNDADLAKTPIDMGLWVDTSHQTPRQTIETILSRAGEALVLP